MSQITTRLISAREQLKAGKFSQAKTTLQQALQKSPADQNALVMMRFCLAHLGEHQQALYFAQQAAKLFPNNSDIMTNLANSLAATGEYEDAIKAAERAVELNPKSHQARMALTGLYSSTGRLHDCFEQAKQGIHDHPGVLGFATYGGTSLVGIGRADEAAQELRPIVSSMPANFDLMVVLASAHAYAVNLEPGEAVAAHRAMGRTLTNLMPEVREPFVNDRTPDRPLRVGLATADARRHAAWFFMRGLVEHYDRSKMSLTIYSNYSGKPDKYMEMMQGFAAKDWPHADLPSWRDISTLEHHDAMRRLREDRIDVLVDMSGPTAGHVMPMLALRAAPVQATWIGYPLTTGVRTIDYRLTDPDFDPAGCEVEHSEKLLHMSPSHFAWTPAPGAPEPDPVPPSQRPAGDSEWPGGITFGSFTSIMKMNEPTVRAWARIIRETPGSRLLFKSAGLRDAKISASVRRRFEVNGMPMDRLVIEGPQKDSDTIMPQYRRVDIALDTWPYNGMTTLCESLHMGVPYITRVGPTTVGRSGMAIAKRLGIEGVTAYDDEQYVTLACALAKDPERLAKLRRELPAKFAASPMRDGPGMARAFEQAIRRAWAAWCEA